VIAALWVAAIIYVLVLQAIGGPRFARSSAVLEQVVFLLLWGAATPAIIWSAERFPIDSRTWVRRVPAHGIVAAAFIIALNFVAPTIAWVVSGRATPFGPVVERSVSQLIAAFHLALIVYAFILGAGHYLRTVDVRRQEQLRAERLRADLATAQLRALTLQLQPHFLFNALNAVGALIITDRKQEAFEVVGRLGELLRALLAIERREEVSLREELELAESYVGIEQARLGDRLRVTWEVAGNIGSAQVPPMVLQPLLENAIRHGVARSPAGGNLTIRASRRGEHLVFDIRDDGPGLVSTPPADGPGSGVGLENTRRRLGALYGDDHALELTRDAGWTRVRVELPYHVLATPALAGAR
jgi:hypothetical protein